MQTKKSLSISLMLTIILSLTLASSWARKHPLESFLRHTLASTFKAHRMS